MKLQTSLGEYLFRNFSNAPCIREYYLLVQESVTTSGRSGLLSFDDARPRVILALLRICMAPLLSKPRTWAYDAHFHQNRRKQKSSTFFFFLIKRRHFGDTSIVGYRHRRSASKKRNHICRLKVIETWLIRPSA